MECEFIDSELRNFSTRFLHLVRRKNFAQSMKAWQLVGLAYIGGEG